MAAAVSAVGSSSVTQAQFLQLLVAQIQNQDPFNPVSSSESIAQLAQFSTLNGVNSLNASFSQMLQLQQLTQGSDLIGKTIHYTPSGSTTSTNGKVSQVNVDNQGNVSLTVGTDQVALNQIQSVTS